MNGLEEKSRRRVAEAMEKVLADTYALFLKTQNYHWNVVGPDFNDLHEMYEAQYQELFSNIDEIAERIRALGFRVPGTFKRLESLTTIEDGKKELEAEEMTKDLADSNADLIKTIREATGIASDEGDYGTMHLLSGRLKAHAKTLWMLRSKTSTDDSQSID